MLKKDKPQGGLGVSHLRQETIRLLEICPYTVHVSAELEGQVFELAVFEILVIFVALASFRFAVQEESVDSSKGGEVKNANLESIPL